MNSCLLQALISHHCGKPLRGNKTQQNKKLNKNTKQNNKTKNKTKHFQPMQDLLITNQTDGFTTKPQDPGKRSKDKLDGSIVRVLNQPCSQTIPTSII